ncbi:nucleotide-diphospho-sugar transferase [Scheffersomyces coipomensis]|uniref:nucleotide-diphospho-sugar transferase n=1 Tax=Scheffersomyces coipomensis TaxID=1788519 RepID=UPI00315D0B9D
MSDLTNSHQNFMAHINHDWPYDLINGLNKFNSFMKGDGYVYLSRKGDESQLMLNIKTLRANGAKLPVEVIIPFEEDYDIEFCDVSLPSLGGSCKVLIHYIDESVLDKIEDNQLKSLALIISSFENVLYMDASNLAIKNPDAFFVNKPFINNHLIVWPDFNRRSASPYFYQISGIKVHEDVKARNSYFSNYPKGKEPGKHYSYHDTKGTIPESSSSGDLLLINKMVHFKTLILALYYNHFGPKYYYPLLNQGGAPANDKETFIAAAHKLGLPYYQVKEFPREFGPLNEAKHHDVYAVGQYDPIVDYIQTHEEEDESEISKNVNEESNNKRKKQLKKSLTSLDDNMEIDELYDFQSSDTPKYGLNEQDSDKNNYNYHLFKASNLFFVKNQKPKLDVVELFSVKEVDDLEKRTNHEFRKRFFGKELIRELNGYDFELSIMRNLHWIYCEAVKLSFLEFNDWNSAEHKEFCLEVNFQIEFLTKQAK